ncbi:MAG: YggS family pyridoxal phosphate-dependent enzyme [Chloroflexi bacterium]|nr:MAG: YggS family pyridoxal phosphate-dependent enzyme [Chloroflexota bacterium]
MTEIAARYRAVRERINRAAERAGREPDEVTLVAVTKTWPVEVVLAAYEAGLRHFGENRAEELAQKQTAVSAQLGPDSGVVWHQIGTLQSRKTRLAADHADWFHALDRPKIARRLSKRLTENGRFLPVLLEVNVSGEATKSGFLADRWETDSQQQAQLCKLVEEVMALPGLSLCGLMTMAPWQVSEMEIRQVFRRTRELARWLETAVSGLHLPYLSMGMTDDFEIAIEEGATHIRVGRALFGPRV